MDYKEKVIALLNSQELSKEQKEKLENIFPELKDSEDEKVKRIIYSIVTKMSFHVHDIFTEEEFQCFDAWCHTWLEKQGEKKPTENAKTLDADKKVDRVIGTADHIKTALDVLNKEGGEE